MGFEAYLALGSNIGDREKNIIGAIGFIGEIPGTTLLKVSNLYETKPVGYLDQDKYLNAVIKVITDVEPLALLKKTQSIEDKLGRIRKIRWGPRSIDIDILMYDDLIVEHPELTIPHSRMSGRAFVLVPLVEVYEGSHITGFKTGIETLLEACIDRNGVKFYKTSITYRSG